LKFRDNIILMKWVYPKSEKIVGERYLYTVYYTVREKSFLQGKMISLP